jgi:hypothetical protein
MSFGRPNSATWNGKVPTLMQPHPAMRGVFAQAHEVGVSSLPQLSIL